MLMYYDKDGLPIDRDHWGTLLANDGYKRVRRTKVISAADPTQSFDVSTVWLGLDHSFGDGLPLIFETMVFAEGGSRDEDCNRYASLKDAEAGHVEMVTVVAATLDDAIVMDAED